MPRVTSPRAGIVSIRFLRKAASSSGSRAPVASQTVTVFAPAATAVSMAFCKKAASLRVASSARNSTSSALSAQALTISSIHASMASGFLRDRYSICTVLTGAMTCSRGYFAPLRASQVSFTLSVFSSTGTATMLLFTAEAMDFTRSASALPERIPSISMTETASLSKSLEISILPLKLRLWSACLASCFIVMSLIRILSIACTLLAT